MSVRLQGAGRNGTRRQSTAIALVVLAILSIFGSSFAGATDHDPGRAGANPPPDVEGIPRTTESVPSARPTESPGIETGAIGLVAFVEREPRGRSAAGASDPSEQRAGTSHVRAEWSDDGPGAGLRARRAGFERPVEPAAIDHPRSLVSDFRLAQFQRPQQAPGDKTPVKPIASELQFQYAWGSDSEVTYRRDSDLDRRLRDNSTIFAPTLFGIASYRPYAWLEGTMELTLERLIPVKEERTVVLPSGEIVTADKKRFSLLVDQAYFRIKGVTDPFEFSFGRRNFEDERLWLYDTALDSASAKLRLGPWHTEASVGREALFDWDLLGPLVRTKTNYYMLHQEYRGIEDHRLAAYAITLNDAGPKEGRPWVIGARVLGRPTDNLNYWGEYAINRGKDELYRTLSGRAFDLGFTYRLSKLPLYPNFTLAYASATGDANLDDNKNAEFRQTGIQSNETRFGGVTQFKRYGEAFDPELSNLKIFTAGIGFIPAPKVWVDIVYHRYRLHHIGNDLRGSALTAVVNQVDTDLSRDVGYGVDIVIGLRNLFGTRLGFEVRAGKFFPGNAYLRNEGPDEAPDIKRANSSISVLAVFIW